MTIKRTFLPGENWLYFKIYGGIDILEQFLKSDFDLFLKKNKRIDLFFFIRYNDPEYHLRIRIYCKEPSHLAPILSSFNKHILKYIQNGTIWNVSLNTYNRELERYFGAPILLAEHLFCANSRLIIKILNKLTEEYRYLFGLVYANRFLDYFNLSAGNKCEYADYVVESFKTEFKFDKGLQVLMDNRYRELGKVFQNFIFENSTAPFLQDMQLMVDSSLDSTEAALKKSLNVLSNSELMSFINSILHMHFNRLFKTNQRQSEFMSYYILFKAYTSVEKRQAGKRIS